MKKIAMTATLLGLLAGCATPINPSTRYDAERPLICIDNAECNTYWQRAQVWVSMHSGYKIQTVSDAVIQTYGPFGHKVELAYSVSRLPRGDGSAQILIKPSCDNMFGCNPNIYEAVVSFKGFVRGN
jgi:hypothetical protein